MRLPLLALLALLSSTGAATQETRPDTDNNTAIYPMCNTVVRQTREHLFHVGHGIEAPRILVRVDPKYSELARHMRLQGTSLLNLVVDKEGFPVNICIERSLFPDLDQNAARAVAQWRFSPATKNGEPVSVVVNVNVAFHLYVHQGSSAAETKKNPASQPHF